MSAKERLLELNARLAEKLATKGVTASANETTTELIKKIDQIQGGDSFSNVFWEGFQQNGTRTNYQEAFSKGYFINDSFKPKYDMRPIVAEAMFASQNTITGDLVELLENAGVTLDFSQATNAWNVFYRASKITRVGICDFRNVTYINTEFFRESSALETIDKLILPLAIPHKSTLFYNDNKLKNVTIEGGIRSSIGAKQSPLTLESAKNFISNLQNYTGTENEFVYTITFSPTTWGYLDAEGNASSNGNTWREYINDLGWNAS